MKTSGQSRPILKFLFCQSRRSRQRWVNRLFDVDDADPLSDSDNDGLTDIEEAQRGTNPLVQIQMAME